MNALLSPTSRMPDTWTGGVSGSSAAGGRAARCRVIVAIRGFLSKERRRFWVRQEKHRAGSAKNEHECDSCKKYRRGRSGIFGETLYVLTRAWLRVFGTLSGVRRSPGALLRDTLPLPQEASLEATIYPNVGALPNHSGRAPGTRGSR